MSRKDEELNRAKGATDRRGSDKDVKKAGRVNQASNRIMRDRRAKQCEDAVARELPDVAVVAMDCVHH